MTCRNHSRFEYNHNLSTPFESNRYHMEGRVKRMGYLVDRVPRRAWFYAFVYFLGWSWFWSSDNWLSQQWSRLLVGRWFVWAWWRLQKLVPLCFFLLSKPNGCWYIFSEQYWMPNETSTDFEQRVLPAYGVHADTEITARLVQTNKLWYDLFDCQSQVQILSVVKCCSSFFKVLFIVKTLFCKKRIDLIWICGLKQLR